MGNYLKQIYKISSANYQTLKETGSLTYNGKTYKYDPNNLYLIENNLTDDYVLTGGGGSKLISELSVKHASTADKATEAESAANAETANNATNANLASHVQAFSPSNSSTPVWYGAGTMGSSARNQLAISSEFTYNRYTTTLKVPNIEGTITEAKHATSSDTATKLSNKLTAGSKTYDGSAAVSLTKSDLGLGNVDNISLVGYTEARGDNLITNGNGIMGNNYNFPALTFDPLVTNNCKGSFRAIGQAQCDISEKISIDLNSDYTLSFDVKVDNANVIRYIYAYVNCYDADNYSIEPPFYTARNNFITTLAKDLKDGDTVVYLTDVSGFSAETETWARGLIFWNYKDSLGYEYGDTYSRNKWDNLWSVSDLSFKNSATNTVSLDKPWSHGEFKAGTRVSQCSSGGTYAYLVVNATSDDYADWVSLKSSLNKSKLRVATRKISFGFLCQWPTNNVSVAGLKMWIANVNLSKTVLQNTDNLVVKDSPKTQIISGPFKLNCGNDDKIIINSTDGKYLSSIDFRENDVSYGKLTARKEVLSWRNSPILTSADITALTNDEIDAAIK